jgi:hypothetical protein
MDGRFVLLGFIVVLAGATARNLQPVRPPGAAAAERAQQRAVDAVIVEVDRAQLCYRRRRDRYADTLPSLAFARGHYMRTAINHGLDITLQTRDDGGSYTQLVTGDRTRAVVSRRGTEVVRLDVGKRSPPQLETHC